MAGNPELNAKIKNVFSDYKRYKYILQNKDFLEELNSTKISQDDINEYQRYCDNIEELLASLSIGDRRIVEHVLIGGKHPSELHLSTANYYVKRNKLLSFLGETLFFFFKKDKKE